MGTTSKQGRRAAAGGGEVMAREYLFKRDGERRLLILDPDTLAQVGFFEVPVDVTYAEMEKFIAHLKREIKGMGN